jgi:hypothetical protein
MAQQPPRSEAAPWIVAGVAGVVLVALLAVYVFALRPDEGKPVGRFTSEERTAIAAAGTEAANALSYRRDHFEQDFQRALQGATGKFANDLKQEKQQTLSTITKYKFDLSARVTHTALEAPVSSGKRPGYTVLVTLNGYQSTNPTNPRQSQVAVTVQRVNGKWLVSDNESIGVGG